MTAETEAQERTEPATPKRRQEAKQKGDIARSRDLTTVVLLMASAGVLLWSGGQVVDGLSRVMRASFSVDRAQLFDPEAMPTLLMGAVTQMAQTLAPFLAVTVAVALIAPLLVGGWIFNLGIPTLEWERLDPVKGLKRLFGFKGLVELLKVLVKVAVLAATATAWLHWQMPTLLGLGVGTPGAGLAHAATVIGQAFLILSGATLVNAAVDVPYQIWENRRRLKMTRHELKEELKDCEGKPEIESRIRALQREHARRRMRQPVDQADVIVTNPTHRLTVPPVPAHVFLRRRSLPEVPRPRPPTDIVIPPELRHDA